jgi:hypothetical protein
MRHPLFSRIAALLFGLGVFFSFSGMIYAYTNWTDPSTSAPGGNIAPPINISPNNQSKSGNLSVGTGLSYWITKSGDSFALNNNAGETKLVIGQDGNVGIGTTGPNSKLDINGTLEVGTGSRGVTLSSSVGDNFQLLTSTNTPYPNFMIGMGNGAGGQDTTKAYIAALPNTVYIMNGNVGIGTSGPTSSLQVAGSTGIKSNYGLTIGNSGGWSPIAFTAETTDKYWNVFSANGGYGTSDLVFRRSDNDETKTVQLLVICMWVNTRQHQLFTPTMLIIGLASAPPPPEPSWRWPDR